MRFAGISLAPGESHRERGKLNNSTGRVQGYVRGNAARTLAKASLGCSHPCARAYTLAVTVRVRARALTFAGGSASEMAEHL